MKNFESAKFDHRLEERMKLVVVLGRRRDQILLSPVVDLNALEQLVEGYESAKMPCAAASLRKRLEWYRVRSEKETVIFEMKEAVPVNK
jgi:hypothetical protein